MELKLPDTQKTVIVIHSGGLDSSTVLLAAHRRYGSEKVRALSFFYGQKQYAELRAAQKLCRILEIKRDQIDLSSYGEAVAHVSANIQGTELAMPTIKEVQGDPAPVTYVPNRNMVMFAIVAAYAEAYDSEVILCGLQSNDEYNYHDTTERWLGKFNDLLTENRKHQIRVYAPLIDWNKAKEIAYVASIHSIPFLEFTLTCYNPDYLRQSCGVCPSCAERLRGFAENGITDPIKYQPR